LEVVLKRIKKREICTFKNCKRNVKIFFSSVKKSSKKIIMRQDSFKLTIIPFHSEQKAEDKFEWNVEEKFEEDFEIFVFSQDKMIIANPFPDSFDENDSMNSEKFVDDDRSEIDCNDSPYSEKLNNFDQRRNDQNFPIN
jgi:hypothetical protein